MSSVPHLRPRVTNELLNAASARITERDRFLCELLADHRVLTTEHICDIAFGSLTTTRHRLSALYDLRVVDRFRPFRHGNVLPYHYVLDEVGVHVVAATRGVDPTSIPWKRDHALRLAPNSHLDHLVGVNGFFAALLRAGRDADDGRLVEWWSERRCRAEWGELVRPDGFGVWREGGRDVQFFLEYDRSTETLERVVAKLDDYERLIRAMGTSVPVLFCFGGPRREAGFRKAAVRSGVRFATASVGDASEAAGAAWLSTGSERRVGIAELA